MPEFMSMRLNGKDLTNLQFYYEDSQTCGFYTYPVFSGATGYKNDPTKTDEKDKGPLPKGRYYVVDRPRGGTQDKLRSIYDYDGKTRWFALFRKDGNINDYTTINGVRRGNFRMHPGGRSAGCVTFKHESDFTKVRNMLLAAKKDKIPGTSTEYYAILLVE